MSEERNAPERLLTPEEVAKHLGYKRGTIYQKVHRKEIPFVKMGHALRFRLSEIERWVEEQEAAAAGEKK